ncbi:LPXTG-motif cell wall-anchored protein [Hydrogenoanaerobacterium saccharovorans]|uniref:LPXTG-motif cell wall anchor domain-containing protein n=1 Tax=Hydrogenoanaerobacterium saccharovorans TaxID=474960 RepID=A0A1H7YMN6_9FIRM|nr:LPXTG cell wall anchor domain-containing protein [Hydrogenoanaerobacterium saccharovorans]RPF49159.1 LPXTG-motif cell wall-anchored protein [Hydrogenoanaerobacterium saccharovorans]SEM46577.1 LPXTG-motif cell wall anchor domain-containing protein [Hydrogenoanaerobacterium saccharovorans]
MIKKYAKFFASVSVLLITIITTAVTAFAINPNTGDNSNVPLVMGIAGGALLLIIIALAVTGKKGKNKKK